MNSFRNEFAEDWEDWERRKRCSIYLTLYSFSSSLLNGILQPSSPSLSFYPHRSEHEEGSIGTLKEEEKRRGEERGKWFL